MQKLVVEGGTPLFGRVRVAGAKNAALPILAATLLAPGEHLLENVPDLVDISSMLSLLGRIGCASLVTDPLRLDTRRIVFCEAPYDLVRKMRASVLVLGPLLARFGEAHVSLPGGCAIGIRPIDQHLKGLEALGCSFTLDKGYVHGRADRLTGAHIQMDVPTVTGTENILMAATLAEGASVIRNAACEPEITDLARFLQSLGARIEGAGTPTIRVQGVSSLTPAPAPYSIMPDRIEAATYLAAVALTGGEVTCHGVRPADLRAVLDKFEETGCKVSSTQDEITVTSNGVLHAVDMITAPYPGFPTDMQAQFMAMMATAKGTCHVTETIFENRFMHVAELLRLGADMEILGNTVRIRGVDSLLGATVMATDLRASASLVLAALAARGRSEILRLYHLDRGYENLVSKLMNLGANVWRVDTVTSRTISEAQAAATG